MSWLKRVIESKVFHAPQRWALRWEHLALPGRCSCTAHPFTNREQLADFNFVLARSKDRHGVSGLLRVRNEQEKIRYSLGSILDVFDEIVLVDNGSVDRTLSIVLEMKDKHDQNDKIHIHNYPFKLARCGPEHFGMPEDSVASLVYFNNWALSHCSYKYVCRWDGDMMLRREARASFCQFIREIDTNRKQCWSLPGQTVYRDAAKNFYLSRNEINKQIMIFPNGFNQRFVKAEHWERLRCRPRLPVTEYPATCFWELKFTEEEEFSHWSTHAWPTERKRLEWENFQLIQGGTMDKSKFEALSTAFLDEELVH